MKSDFEQLAKTQALLAQALGCARASLNHNPAVTEAKGHIRHAIDKLQKVQKKKTQMKKQTEETAQEKWWGNIVAGTVDAPMASVSQEAYNRTLKELNMMIDSEKKNLNDLENQVRQNSGQNTILNG